MESSRDVANAPAVAIVPPGRPLVGRVVPPGSKSITNRALLLAGLARGESVLRNALASDDTGHMAQALRRMGVPVRQDEDDGATTFVVSGTGRLAPPDGPLLLGNAGTAMRFLTAAAALVDGTVVLDGDAHMRKRPIGPLTAALGALGVEARDTEGRPPVTVRGRGAFGASAVTIDAGLSSQYVSALLMAAACNDRPVTVALAGAAIGARGYVDLTLAAMRAFGAQVLQEDVGRWRLSPTGYRACAYRVEPDASAATYLWAAEQLTGGAIDLGVAPADMTQPDAAAHDLIARFPRLPETIDGSQIQDAVPTLAALAAFNETPVRFVGIANLRVKECDRIRAMATELARVRPGLAREEGDDLVVAGDPDLAATARPARIETYADHRIAMSMALVGLRVPGVTILDPACTAKTYPRYWRDLARLGVVLRPE
ncbi:3-phosphoshikimate 1-carboxyvinyltransferase [Salinarimonas rosea]|uniref:3-phosphoshikimate 1-carboxyvinyltransferase n=1 Tax=Salinarimonas rosea TaxID=552063 RepID=UPI0003F5DF83|nr:3-phosphoshikimate 1-carboxyvinyltransferase [Salinarimonas rosea]